MDGWRDRTPPGFLFAAKFPQVITHEKLLEGCREELVEFLRVMERLGDKLGPLLLQFRYFRLAEILRRHGVALAFIDHPWFPPIARLERRPELVTADFHYVRWLGDRRAIEERTRTWDRLIVDRRREIRAWIPALRALLEGGRGAYGHFNNHYAGYAVGSIELFRHLWGREPPGPGL